jgi:flagellar assembly factor FliW
MSAEIQPVGTEPAESGDLPVIEFVRPIPGFPDHRRFVLTRIDQVTRRAAQVVQIGADLPLRARLAVV